MVAGYPVSVVGQGAFIDTDTVKSINLPDTIMEIQKGAIAKGINVVYMSNNTDGPVQSNSGGKSLVTEPLWSMMISPCYG